MTYDLIFLIFKIETKTTKIETKTAKIETKTANFFRFLCYNFKQIQSLLGLKIKNYSKFRIASF